MSFGQTNTSFSVMAGCASEMTRYVSLQRECNGQIGQWITPDDSTNTVTHRDTHTSIACRHIGGQTPNRYLLYASYKVSIISQNYCPVSTEWRYISWTGLFIETTYQDTVPECAIIATHVKLISPMLSCGVLRCASRMRVRPRALINANNGFCMFVMRTVCRQ